MEYAPLARKLDEFQQPPAASEVEALCRRLLPDAAPPAAAREIGGGMFNNTFLLTLRDGGRYVLRIAPPHGHPALFANEHLLMRREHALGPALAGVDSVAPLLPKVLATDFSCELGRRDAVLSAFIEGDNWDTLQKGLPPEDNDAIWRELGGLLARIHQAHGPAFGWTAPEQPHATWSSFILSAARGLLADYPRFHLAAEEPHIWFAAAEAGAAILDQITVPHLVHGDPWPKNILVRRSEGRLRIVGLLDHERGLWGDPMDEWVFHFMNYPPPFWEAYGPRPEGPAAAFRAAAYHGLIHTQVLLEGWRYHFDVSVMRHQLVETAQRMDTLRHACGIR